MSDADRTREPASATPDAPSNTAPAGPDSPVERWFLERSGQPFRIDPVERIGIIEVEDFPSLGKLTALRFLEWVLHNPEGVISLPTGKTPEYFIRWTRHFLERWHTPEAQNTLAEVGLPGLRRPDMRGLTFVQIDEFYPIEPSQHNSFHYYVMKHYVRGLGLDADRALLIDPSQIGLPTGETLGSVFPDGKVDLSLRARQPADPLEAKQLHVIQRVDQFCSDYETRIRELGGIGFFLGGIGPDGHIGFNARGSHLHSVTRLTRTNYETEAAAAGDLGGIEISRGKPVITIGLGTITHRPDAVIIVFAAGEAKARVVADAVTRPRHVLYPASVLQGLPGARFYLTRGAGVRLEDRRIHAILREEHIDEEWLESAVLDAAIDSGRRLDALDEDVLPGTRRLARLLERTGRNLAEAAGWARERLIARIDRGLDTPGNESILHTGPHHDDIMLGYMPLVMHLVRNSTNRNYFCVLTSGFTAVTNRFLATVLEDLAGFLDADEYAADLEDRVFDPDNASARAEEVYGFLDGIAARDPRLRRRFQARRMLHHLMRIYEDDDPANLRMRIEENLHYLRTLYPGKKDIPQIQQMKGFQREYEEELIWGYVGTAPDDVFHLRLGFYTGDIFTRAPTVERDVEPVLALLLDKQPTTVSLALDPEGAGPDTHYKVLQVLHEALLRYRERTGLAPRVLGYRNVWFRFHPAEADILVPATLNTMAIMQNSFKNCFGSQRDASFPSYAYDGPFSELAQTIWVEQYRQVQTCLGERYFIDNPHPRLRAARGFVFLKSMDLDAFSGKARSLARLTEGVE